MGILKIKYLEDLYHGKLFEDLENGWIAENTFGRIKDCLKKDLGIPVTGIFQWYEERNPNGIPGFINHVWPVGLIRTYSQTFPTDNILNYSRFGEFKFDIKKVSNSSGGVNPNKIGEYLFTLYPQTHETYRASESIGKQILNKFEKDPNFKPVGRELFDYALIEGEDEISGGRIMIELGNKPIISKNILGMSRKGSDTETSLPSRYYVHQRN